MSFAVHNIGVEPIMGVLGNINSQVGDLQVSLDDHHAAVLGLTPKEGDVTCPEGKDGKPFWFCIQPQFLKDICEYYNNFAKWRTQWAKIHPHDMDSILFIAQMQNAAFATLYDHVHCLSINTESVERINILLAEKTRATNIATLTGETNSPRCVFDLGSSMGTEWGGSAAQTSDLWYTKHDTLIPTWSWARPSAPTLAAHNIAIRGYDTPVGTPAPLKFKQINPVSNSTDSIQRRKEIIQCMPSQLLKRLRLDWNALPPSWKGGYNMLKVPILKFTVQDYYEYWPPLGAPAKILFEQNPEVAFGLKFPAPLGNPGAILQNYPRIIIQPQKLEQIVLRGMGQPESYLVAPAIVQIAGDFRYAQANGDHPSYSLMQTLEKYRPIAAHTGGGTISSGTTSVELKIGDTITQSGPTITGEITKNYTTDNTSSFILFAKSHVLTTPLKPETEMVITRAGVHVVTYTAAQVLNFQDEKRFRVTAPWSLESQYNPADWDSITEEGLPQADTKNDALNHLTPFVNGSDITTLRHLKTIQLGLSGEALGVQVFDVVTGLAGSDIPPISGTRSTTATTQPFPLFGTQNLIMIDSTLGAIKGAASEGAQAPYNTSIGQAGRNFSKAVRSFLGGTSRGNEFITMDDGTPLPRPLTTSLNSSWLGVGKPLTISGDWLEIVDDSVTPVSGPTLKMSDPLVTQYIVDTSISYYKIDPIAANRLTVDRGAPSNGNCVQDTGLKITWTPTNTDQITAIEDYSVAIGGNHAATIFGKYYDEPTSNVEHIAIGAGIIVDTVTDAGGGAYTVTLKPGYKNADGEVVSETALLAMIATIAGTTPVQFRKPGKRFSWQPITSMHGVFTNVKLTTDSYDSNKPRSTGRFNNYSLTRDFDLTGRKGAYDIVILLCWQYKLLGPEPTMSNGKFLPSRMPSSIMAFLRDVTNTDRYENVDRIQTKHSIKQMFEYVTKDVNLVQEWGYWNMPGTPDLADIFKTRHRLPDIELLVYTDNNSGGSAFLPVVLPSHQAIDLRKKMRFVLGSYQSYHVTNPITDTDAATEEIYKVALSAGGNTSYKISWPVKIVSDSEHFCVENLDVIVRVFGNWKLTTHEYNIRLATQFNYMGFLHIWPLKTVSGVVITAYDSGSNHPNFTSPYLRDSINLVEASPSGNVWSVVGNDQCRSGIRTSSGTVVGGPLPPNGLFGRLANSFAVIAGFKSPVYFITSVTPKDVEHRSKKDQAYKARFQTAIMFLMGYVTQGLATAASTKVQHDFIGALTCYLYVEAIKEKDKWESNVFKNTEHFHNWNPTDKLKGYDWDAKKKWTNDTTYIDPRFPREGFQMTCNLDIIRNFVYATRSADFLKKPRYGYQTVQQPNYGARIKKEGPAGDQFNVPFSNYKTLADLKTEAEGKSSSYTPSILMNNRWKAKKTFFNIPFQGTTYGWDYDELGDSAVTPPEQATNRGGPLGNNCVWCSVLQHLSTVTPNTLKTQVNILDITGTGGFENAQHLRLLQQGFGFVQIQKYTSSIVTTDDSAPESVVTLPILTGTYSPTTGLDITLAQPMEPELVNFLNGIISPQMLGSGSDQFDSIATYAHVAGEPAELGVKQALIYVCIPDALGLTRKVPDTRDFLSRSSWVDTSTVKNTVPQLAARISQRNSQVIQVAKTGSGATAKLTVNIRDLSQLGTPTPSVGTIMMIYANKELDDDKSRWGTAAMIAHKDLRYLGKMTAINVATNLITLELIETVGTPAAALNYDNIVTALKVYMNLGVSPLLVRLNEHSLMEEAAGTFNPKTGLSSDNTVLIEISGGKVKKQILVDPAEQPVELASVSRTVSSGVISTGRRMVPVKKGAGTVTPGAIVTCTKMISGPSISTVVSNNGSSKALVTVSKNSGMISVGTSVKSTGNQRWTGSYTVVAYTLSDPNLILELSGEADIGTSGSPTTLQFSNETQVIEPSHGVRVSALVIQAGASVPDFLYLDRLLPFDLYEDDILTITPDQMIKLPLTAAMSPFITHTHVTVPRTLTKLYLRPTVDYVGVNGGVLTNATNTALSSLRPGIYEFSPLTSTPATNPVGAKLEMVVPAVITMTNSQYTTLNTSTGQRINLDAGGLNTYPYQGMINSVSETDANTKTLVVYPTPESPIWPIQETAVADVPPLKVRADYVINNEDHEFVLRKITKRLEHESTTAIFTCGSSFYEAPPPGQYIHVTFSSTGVPNHSYKNKEIVDSCVALAGYKSRYGFLLRMATDPTGDGLPPTVKPDASSGTPIRLVQNYWFELHRLTSASFSIVAADLSPATFVPLTIGATISDTIDLVEDNPTGTVNTFLPIKLVSTKINTSVTSIFCRRGTTEAEKPFFRAIEWGKFPPADKTTLVTAITDSSTTIVLTSSLEFPAPTAPATGTIYIGTEFITYTANNTGTGTLTGVTRGISGTSATAHNVGVIVTSAPASLFLSGNVEVSQIISGLPVECVIVEGEKRHIGVPGFAARYVTSLGVIASITIDAYDSTTVGFPGYANRFRNFAELTACTAILGGFTLTSYPMVPQWSLMLEYDPYLPVSLRRNKWSLQPVGDILGNNVLTNLDNRGSWGAGDNIGQCNGFFRDWENTLKNSDHAQLNVLLQQNSGTVSLTDPTSSTWEPLKYGLTANSNNFTHIKSAINPSIRVENALKINGGMEEIVGTSAITSMAGLILNDHHTNTLCTSTLIPFTAIFSDLEPFAIMVHTTGATLGHNLIENRLAFFIDDSPVSNYPTSFPVVSGFYGGQRVSITDPDGTSGVAVTAAFPNEGLSEDTPFTILSYVNEEAMIMKAVVQLAPAPSGNFRMTLTSAAAVRKGDEIKDVTGVHHRAFVERYEGHIVELHNSYTAGALSNGDEITIHREELRYIELKPPLTPAQRTHLQNNDVRLTVRRFPSSIVPAGITIFQGPEHTPKANTKSFCSDILGTIQHSTTNGAGASVYKIAASRQMRDGGCTVNGVPTILDNITIDRWNADYAVKPNQPINLEAGRILNKMTLTNSVINPGCLTTILEFDYNPWSSNKHGADGRIQVEQLKIVAGPTTGAPAPVVEALFKINPNDRVPCPSFMTLSTLTGNDSGPLGYRLYAAPNVLNFSGDADCPTAAYTRLYRFGPAREVIDGGQITYRATLKKWNGVNVVPGDIDVASGTNVGGFTSIGHTLEPLAGVTEWLFDPCDRKPINIDEVSMFNNALSTRVAQRTWRAGEFSQQPPSDPPAGPGTPVVPPPAVNLSVWDEIWNFIKIVAGGIWSPAGVSSIIGSLIAGTLFKYAGPWSAIKACRANRRASQAAAESAAKGNAINILMDDLSGAMNALSTRMERSTCADDCEPEPEP